MEPLQPHMDMLAMPEKPSQVIRYVRALPVTPGEWLALVRRQSKELTIREAAVELDVSPARVHHLCAQGELQRTRRGFISTRALFNYVAKQRARYDEMERAGAAVQYRRDRGAR